MYTIVVVGWCIVLLVAMTVAANLFAKRRRASGDWDEAGPKHPTDPPAGFLDPRHGGKGDLADMFPPQKERGQQEQRD
ncbi:MAG: hypothetical protein ACRD9W_22465 [Terriglobia bacterium]